MKMKHIISSIFGAALASCAVSSAVAESADSNPEFKTGMRAISIQDEVKDRHLEGFIWYPSLDDSKAILAHGNAVWQAIRVIPDAAPAAGNYPLVVLSHGMFGNSRNQAWLAEIMTKRGYVVAAIDHPGTSTFKRDKTQQRELWERPRDITRLLDHILEEDALAKQIDTGSIFMAGHSLGGFTATMLAGGRFDPDKMDEFCAANEGELVCGIFDRWNVAKSAEDRQEIANDYSDPRLSGIVSFDLGGTQSFSSDSLATIKTKMLVVGAPVDIAGLNLDIESRALANALPDNMHEYWEPETVAHFDFLGVCTENALSILKEEEPDDVFVCQDGTDQRRTEHDMIAEKVINFIETN